MISLRSHLIVWDHYHALARYIELGWRKGDLEQVEKHMKAAVDTNPRATVDAGYNYCKGLIEWWVLHIMFGGIQSKVFGWAEHRSSSFQ